LEFTLHVGEAITNPEGAVKKHPSLDLNPVPSTVTGVPRLPGTGGEPIVGVSLTDAVTVNVADAESPLFPVIVTVYSCPGAVFETMKNVLVSAPAEVIAQLDEVNRRVSLDTMELQGPASSVENVVLVIVTVWPAAPVVGPKVMLGAISGTKLAVA
jgi:hypothetical protein